MYTACLRAYDAYVNIAYELTQTIQRSTLEYEAVSEQEKSHQRAQNVLHQVRVELIQYITERKNSTGDIHERLHVFLFA